VESGDVNRAQQIFNKTENKTMVLYGATMKGEIV
jgi:hypothetical protein